MSIIQLMMKPGSANHGVCKFQPEYEQCLWNASLFSVVHFFDSPDEKTGKDDILWLAMVTCDVSPFQGADINRNIISKPDSCDQRLLQLLGQRLQDLLQK